MLDPAADAELQKLEAELKKMEAQWKQIKWEQGPCQSKMSDASGSEGICQVDVPAGYKFTGRAGTKILMDMTKNPFGTGDLGVLAPVEFTLLDEVDAWFLVYEWDPIGLIKDDDKNLDADAMLQGLQQNQERDNQQARITGRRELTLTGWQQPPFYDPDTKLLSWGIRLQSKQGGGESINYHSRLLGRRGVLSLNLVISPGLLQQALPHYKQIIKATSFQPGQTYGEWKTGNKVATYGLAALVTGGVAAGLAKSGILGKLGKFIIYIVIAVVAGIGSLFKKIFGGRSSTA